MKGVIEKRYGDIVILLPTVKATTVSNVVRCAPRLSMPIFVDHRDRILLPHDVFRSDEVKRSYLLEARRLRAPQPQPREVDRILEAMRRENLKPLIDVFKVKCKGFKGLFASLAFVRKLVVFEATGHVIGKLDEVKEVMERLGATSTPVATYRVNDEVAFIAIRHDVDAKLVKSRL